MAKRKKPLLIRASVIDKQGKFNVQTIRADSLKSGQIRHVALTTEQQRRAVALWDRIGKRARPDIDLVGWIEGFRREVHPNTELSAWEAIARTVEKLWHDPMSKDLTQIQLLSAIITASAGAVDIPSQVPGITDAMAAKINDTLNQEFKLRDG